MNHKKIETFVQSVRDKYDIPSGHLSFKDFERICEGIGEMKKVVL